MKDQFCCNTPHDNRVEEAACVIERLASLQSVIAGLEADFSTGLLGLLDLSQSAGAESAASSGSDSGMVLRGYLMELSRMVQMSDRALESRAAVAYDLATKYPDLLKLQKAGSVSTGVAAVVVRAGTELWNVASCPTCEGFCSCGFDLTQQKLLEARTREFQHQMCDYVTKPGVNVSSAKRFATNLAEQLMEEPLEDRQTNALHELQAAGLRQIEISQGIVETRFITTAVDAAILKSRLKKIAKLKKQDAQKQAALQQNKKNSAPGTETSGGDAPNTGVPSVGVLETETLLEIINGELDETYKHVQGEVGITLPFETLIGSSHGNYGGASRGVFLEGYGPVALDDTILGIIGSASSWTRIFTDPITGQILATDTYQPTAAQKRFLKYRDRGCRWQGCGAQKTDIDHTAPWATGGKTVISNLAQLCRRHHMAKHHSGWALKQLEDGVLEWKSPTGKTYIDKPDSYDPINQNGQTLKRVSRVKFVKQAEPNPQKQQQKQETGGIPPPF